MSTVLSIPWMRSCILHHFSLPPCCASLQSTINAKQSSLYHIHRPTSVIAFNTCDIQRSRSHPKCRHKHLRCLNIPSNPSSLPSNCSTSTSHYSSQGSAKFDESSPNSQAEVQFDLNLPRRRLLVEFTCNSCGTRSRRIINPDAYERGTVFVQCGGCEVYHKLVDKLHLVEEYDFRKDLSADSANTPESQDDDPGE